MANIGATTAYYRVETALTRANNEVSRSMERLATGRANANPGDRTFMLQWQILFVWIMWGQRRV